MIDILPATFEPKKQYLWALSIGGGIEAWMCRTVKRPDINFEEITLDYMNTRRYLAGKFDWQTLDVTLLDPIDNSAADAVIAWIRTVGDEYSTAKFPASDYKRQITITLLDGAGLGIETWVLEGVWPQATNFGDLDYSANDPVEITMTLRYDRAWRTSVASQP